jgi:hypothetical protein
VNEGDPVFDHEILKFTDVLALKNYGVLGR